MDDKVALPSAVPPVGDLDGTLLRIDTLHESLALVFSHNPKIGCVAWLSLHRTSEARRANPSCEVAIPPNPE
jgi:hypothetical protein